MRLIFREFDDRSTLVGVLADEISQHLKRAISLRKRASLVATGGTTVPLLYRRLRQTRLAWGQVNIALSDERWSDHITDSSNFNLVSSELLKEHAAAATLIPLRGEAETLEEAILAAHKELGQLNFPFDVTLLGMGADMHAASLLPHAPGVREGLDRQSRDRVCKIGPIDGAADASIRMSLTLPTILASRVIYIMITGAEKRAAYEMALSSDEPIKAPVSAILKQSVTPVYVYWAP